MKTLLLKPVIALATLAILLNLPVEPDHAASRPEEVHKVLLDSVLLDPAGKQMMLMTVDYLPGQASEAHIHPGPVMAYVLDGEVISQLEGDKPRHYKKGESWFEPAFTHHLVSRNASEKRPATLLVFALLGKDDPIKMPIPSDKMNMPVSTDAIKKPST